MYWRKANVDPGMPLGIYLTRMSCPARPNDFPHCTCGIRSLEVGRDGIGSRHDALGPGLCQYGSGSRCQKGSESTADTPLLASGDDDGRQGS